MLTKERISSALPKNADISILWAKENHRFLGGLWWMIRGSNAILLDFPNRSKR